MKYLFVGGPVHLKYIEADGSPSTYVLDQHMLNIMAEDQDFAKEHWNKVIEPILYRRQLVRPNKNNEYFVYCHPSIKTDFMFNDLIFSPRT